MAEYILCVQGENVRYANTRTDQKQSCRLMIAKSGLQKI